MRELVVEPVGADPGRGGFTAVDYHEAWELQRRRHADVVAGRAPDTVLLLQHSPVYTAGRRTNSWERPDDGTPVVDVDRGGRITWHGPGQLVGYPIVRLDRPLDVVDYVRRLEEFLLAVVARFGVQGYRVPERTGVWVRDTPLRPGWRSENKLAALGVRVAKGVTMHGFALNCDTDLQGFSHIVPCGLPDAGATSLSARAGRRITVEAAAAVVTELLPTAHLPG